MSTFLMSFINVTIAFMDIVLLPRIMYYICTKSFVDVSRWSYVGSCTEKLMLKGKQMISME